MGQPGYVGRPEDVPRSPHKRVLPETPSTRKGPGLWAGDGPMNSAANDDAEPTFLGVTLPSPEETESPYWKQPASLCAIMLTGMLDNSDAKETAPKLPLEERRCIAASSYIICLAQLIDGTKHDRYPQWSDAREAVSKALLRSLWTARAFHAKACDIKELSVLGHGIVNALANPSLWATTGAGK